MLVFNRSLVGSPSPPPALPPPAPPGILRKICVCAAKSYVETLLGRRRYLPQINSEDAKERSRAERQAANTVCQGSAADLLKLAATNVAARCDSVPSSIFP